MGRKPQLLCAALACAALGCKRQAPVPTLINPGQTHYAIQAPAVSGLTSIDYNFRFFYLGAQPAEQYASYSMTAGAASGAAAIVLPCKVGAGGTGLNQVLLDATMHFAAGDAVQGHATALFTCMRESDTPVSLVVSVVRPGYGDGDLNALALGTQCDSRADLRGDDVLAVCGDASCGDAAAAFVFTNACTALDGSAPQFFACGAAADWTLLGTLARAQLPVPPRAGSFLFSVAALGQLKLSPPNSTLTDAAGNVRVWGATATPRALLTEPPAGPVVATLDAGAQAAFTALLDVPGGTAQALLEVRHSAAGAQLFGWARFAACDRAALGAASAPGLFAVDVRLASPSSATIFFAAVPSGVATSSALCTASIGADGLPAVSCGAAAPLVSP